MPIQPEDYAAYREPLRAIAPAESSVAIVDVDDSDFVTQRGCTLYVGTAGDICVDLFRDADETKTIFKDVAVGPFNYRIKKLYGSADGTTAGDLVMVW